MIAFLVGWAAAQTACPSRVDALDRLEEAVLTADYAAAEAQLEAVITTFACGPVASAEQLARLTPVDYEREMALLAVRPAVPGGLAGETVAVARLVREMDSGEAEFAVVVQGDAKGGGVGSALMRQLIDWGRSKGVREVVGQILADNAPMLAFIRRLGFRVKRSPEDADIMEARLVLEPPAVP